MKYEERIIEIANNNNGIVTSSTVTDEKIPREYLRILVRKGMLVRSERGIYTVPTIFDDELFNLQNRYKRGIFSHETSLFLLDLSDRAPLKYSMTFPLSYNTGSLKKRNIKYYRVKESLYDVGIIDFKSPSGNRILIYNSERSLCDILKGRSKTDIQIITDAFKRYIKSKNRNIPLLSRYAKMFRVYKKIKPYLEVLL